MGGTQRELVVVDMDTLKSAQHFLLQKPTERGDDEKRDFLGLDNTHPRSVQRSFVLRVIAEARVAQDCRGQMHYYGSKTLFELITGLKGCC